MRRARVVGLDPFQFHGFQDVGLALDLLFQVFHQFGLADDDIVQLFDLVFQVGDVRFEFFQPA